ncbi:MAG: hypothetical protein WC472_01650 [Candidatus Paceibacterota bacterium]
MPFEKTSGSALSVAEFNATIKVAGLYAVTTGSANAYVLTVSPVPATLITGDVFRFKANFSNTSSATLNVNGLGAKAIKKNYNQNLEIGDIESGQLVTVMYDGTNFQLLSPFGSNNYIKNLIIGEAINGSTTPKPVFMYDGSSLIGTAKIWSGGSLVYSKMVQGNTWQGQSFTIPTGMNRLTKVVFMACMKQGTPPSSITASVYATNGSGFPTGSALTSVNIPTSTLLSGSPTSLEFIFPTPLNVTVGTKYAVYLYCSGGDVSNYVSLGFYMSDSISNGNLIYTDNAGSTWYNEASNEQYIYIYGYDSTTYLPSTIGNVYLSKDTDPDRNSFLGFIVDNISSGSSGNIKNSGLLSGFSGLSPGKKYYVDSGGAISTSAGTYSILCGVAINTTTILIVMDNLRL